MSDIMPRVSGGKAPNDVSISVPAAGILSILIAGIALAVVVGADSQWLVAGVSLSFFTALILFRASRLGRKSVDKLHEKSTCGNVVAVGVAVTMLLLFHEDHYALLMIATLAIYGTACCGLNLQMGTAGIPNFAGAAFFSVGAYTAAMLAAQNVPSPLALICGALASGLAGIVVIFPVLRTRGHYAALVTIAFGLLLRIFLEVNDTFGGPQGLKVPSFDVAGLNFNDVTNVGGWELSFYFPYVSLAVLICTGAFILTRRMEHSWLGISFDAIRTDEISASAFGIDVARTKAIAFFSGNLLIGLAGALYGFMVGFVNPNGAGFGESLVLISIITLGGIGNRWGSMIAAVVILVLPEKLHSIQEFKLLIFALLVIGILLFRPGGLLPRALRSFRQAALSGGRDNG